MEKLRTRLSLNLYNKLVKANIASVSSIVTKSELELLDLTQLSISEINTIKQQASQIILNTTFKSAKDVTEWQRLSTGCDVIDSALRGGFPINGINEIAGPSGVGKTQLCLQLSLRAQFSKTLGGLEKGCVYICTEDVFPSKRLHQLANLYSAMYPAINRSIKFEDHIFIEHISNYEQLQGCLQVRLPKLLTVKKIGLIIIDSIAGLFRSENFGINYSSRSQELYDVATELYKLSHTYNIAIICTNQVSDNPDSGKTEPALGLAWSNLVTSRFSINRCDGNYRIFKTIFTSDVPEISCKFTINDRGLIGIH